MPVVVADQAQWIAAGQLAVQVQFLCGEVYINSFSTEGMESIQPSAVSIQKVLIDGQIYLLYNGTMYNVQGVRIQNSKFKIQN